MLFRRYGERRGEGVEEGFGGWSKNETKIINTVSLGEELAASPVPCFAFYLSSPVKLNKPHNQDHVLHHKYSDQLICPHIPESELSDYSVLNLIHWILEGCH